MPVHEGTRTIFRQIADKYAVPGLLEVIESDESIVWTKDVTICSSRSRAPASPPGKAHWPGGW